MLIQGYQLYFQICLLYFYESQRCEAIPQLHDASHQIEADSSLNRRLETPFLQQNKEQFHYANNVHVQSFPYPARPITENWKNYEINYHEILPKYSLLPHNEESISKANSEQMDSHKMERDPNLFFNTDIAYISTKELQSLLNFYIDVAMSKHRSPIVEHRSILPTSTTSESHKAMQPGYRSAFPPFQYQQKVLHRGSKLANNFIIEIDSLGSSSIPNLYKVRDDETFSRDEILEFPYKNDTNPFPKVQWRKLTNNSEVPFLYGNTYEISRKEITRQNILKNEDQIGNLIKNFEVKTGLKVERVINDNHIEIKIIGTPQRKIRLRKGRKRQKPFQRGPLIREKFQPKISSPYYNQELRNYFGPSYETFESKRMNPIDPTTKGHFIDVANHANNERSHSQESKLRGNQVENEIEFQSSKKPRYPKSIKVQTPFHLNPKFSLRKNTKSEIEDSSNENKFNTAIKLTKQTTVKRKEIYKKYRKVPKLEFPFPKSFLSGMSFLIKGHEDLGPHVIIKEDQQN